MSMDEVVACTLFGCEEISLESRGRQGKMLLMARVGARLVPDWEMAAVRGKHGGLGPEEMRMPLSMVGHAG